MAAPFVDAGWEYYPWDSEAHKALSHEEQYEAIKAYMASCAAYILVLEKYSDADLSASRMQIMSALETHGIPVIVVDPLDGERTASTKASLYSQSHTAVSNYITRVFRERGQFHIVRTARQALALLAVKA